MRQAQRIGLLSAAILISGTKVAATTITTTQYRNTTTTGITSAPSSDPSSRLTYPDPTGVSTVYTTTSYNYSLASTYLPQTDFSDERLAFLWDQVGPISTASVTTTVSPTPEPSSFASPGIFHPYVPSYQPALNNASLPKNFIWGVASSAFQIEVSEILFECTLDRIKTHADQSNKGSGQR